jgi:CRISPR-associated protein Cas2
MMVLLCYDVSTKTPAGERRLHKVAKTCEQFGQRVQNSVFECEMDPARFEVLRSKLTKIYEPDEDSLRFYYMGSNWERRVEHLGAKPAVDMKGPLIV